ncbi:MAG: hypothetical protein D3916_16230, partial [Candidatus Electrothrix sp. MAN1_4]|nr:hypothetical protein [Candidatus Electrothrix sp. MAN1_4]
NFLQVDQLTEELTEDDWNEAYQDVSSTLLELARAVELLFGRAAEVIAYQAGTRAAPHFPEVYELETSDQQLEQLRQKLCHCFDFKSEQKTDGTLIFRFRHCAIYPIVTEAGETAGESILCRMFHHFFSGLLSGIRQERYTCNHTSCGTNCILDFSSTGQTT